MWSFTFRNEFMIKTTEHTLEVYAHESKTKRLNRLKQTYGSKCHKYANDIRKRKNDIGTITTVQTQAVGVVRTFLASVMEYIKQRFTGTAE